MEEIEAKKIKLEMIEKSAEQFKHLNDDNKMFILGYMIGIEQERQKGDGQPQTAEEVHR